MLILILLVHLLSGKADASSGLLPEEPPTTHATTATTVGGCLTLSRVPQAHWVSECAPSRPESAGFLLAKAKVEDYRDELMLIAVIAPELVCGLLYHYFISMGGFVTGTGGHPIVTKEQIREHISDIARVREKAIRDKSKGDALNYNPVLSNSVPTFWAIVSADNMNRDYTLIPLIAELIVGSTTVHCAAWNASFLSSDEMWMWRSC
ncbi:hypothetical protein GGX14DRAFT_606436 [Mycena pura]|uniref:Uncharacterized protein n=1 Tax=Mycena pura TaxID=153505 RepID=A0AAD6XZT8_9AGAR|nr:hypothetical protein GGX14DRAFT_606436 [Mycena pura]